MNMACIREEEGVSTLGCQLCGTPLFAVVGTRVGCGASFVESCLGNWKKRSFHNPYIRGKCQKWVKPAMWRIVPRIAFSSVRPGRSICYCHWLMIMVPPGGRRGPARIRKSSRPPGSPLETLRRGAPPRISPETSSSTAVLKAALETKALASSQLPAI